jgi:F-type H+-transporting ATPase subunit delta
MQAASREALEVTEATFAELALGTDTASLEAWSAELSALARLLVREPVLRKHLADKADESAAPKIAIVDRLFAGKLTAATIELLHTAVAQRWSLSTDLSSSIHRFARLSTLIEAERTGVIETVEDELFRFGRVLDANPRLAALLGDASTQAEGRVTLLRSVLDGKANPLTSRLLEDAASWPRVEHFAALVDKLAAMAAARRGESVAHVVAAAPLTAEQIARCGAVLARIYGRSISVQIDVDPEVLGGLRITVGDEVIDGTIATRLAAAASQLPR